MPEIKALPDASGFGMAFDTEVDRSDSGFDLFMKTAALLLLLCAPALVWAVYGWAF
jgi:hypothetical protein